MSLKEVLQDQLNPKNMLKICKMVVIYNKICFLEHYKTYRIKKKRRINMKKMNLLIIPHSFNNTKPSKNILS